MSDSLPEWVVERCDRAAAKAFIWDGARHEELYAAALAEFVKIIGERAGPEWAITWCTEVSAETGVPMIFKTASLAELLHKPPRRQL